LIFSIVIYQIITRAKEMPLLVKEGVIVQAKIVSKSPKKTRRENIDYEFQDALGKVYRRHITLPLALFDQVQVGDSIEVVYLPQNPKVSSGKYWVDQYRAAMSYQKSNG
ncbi:MAG: hypothetical protein JNK65_06440, partial [Deltaproteobacteria bacterium]|nr:hypothetical protein [Deltaproteobacteria bacterium]